MMSAAKKQFSFTRVALSTLDGEKNKFLSIKLNDRETVLN